MKMNLNKTFIKNTVGAINNKKFRWNSNPVYIWFTWDGIILYEIDMNYEILDYFESKKIPRSETFNTTHIIENAKIVVADDGQLFELDDFNHVLKHRKDCYMLKASGKKYYFEKKYINQFLKANYQYSIFEWPDNTAGQIYGIMVYEYDNDHHIPAFSDLMASVVFICGVCFYG